MPEQPTVIRNTPAYSKHAFRSTGERIEVLYHGVVAAGRGLEECICSVKDWRSEFRLTIRGPASAEYQSFLERIALEAGVKDRVVFAEPVPMVSLVSSASEYDVGLFAIPNHSLQNKYVLPNKFFEYVMAGLALCVSDSPEMNRLVRRHDLGSTIKDVTPRSIAESINSLERSSIDSYKQNSLAAAQELNWDRESEKLVSLVVGALETHSG